MIIVDTNILARIIINDNEVQAKAAQQILEKEQVFISKTVLLELQWLLENHYELKRQEILSVLENLLQPSNVTIEDLPQVKLSFKRYADGMDFADAMHLSAARGSVSTFVTFDEKLTKIAKRYDDSTWRPKIINGSDFDKHA